MVDVLLSAVLIWYAFHSPDRERVDVPPDYVFWCARNVGGDGQLSVWAKFDSAGLIHRDRYGTEFFATDWFDGAYYVLYRRAVGRPLPYRHDINFGWKEMHP